MIWNNKISVAVFILLSIILFYSCGGGGGGGGGNGQNNGDIFIQALNENLIYFGISDDGTICNRGYCYSAERRACAFYYLVNKALEGNVDAENRIFAHIRNLLTPGNEPDTSGSLSCRGHAQIFAGLALLRSQVKLWDKLLNDEKNKINILMKAALISTAATSSDQTNFSTGLDGCGNFGKTWNPNYREGFLGELIAATLYFGESEAIDILNNFNCADFLNAVRNNNLPNVVRLFEYDPLTTSGCSTTPSGQDLSYSEIEAAVANYTFNGHNLTQLTNIFSDSITKGYGADSGNNGTFAREVSCQSCQQEIECYSGSDNFCTGIHSDCNNLPNFGQNGMLWEFLSWDKNCVLRSSLSYSAQGWINAIVSQSILNHYGFSIPEQVTILIDIGSTDLFYKAEKGYNSYANSGDQN